MIIYAIDLWHRELFEAPTQDDWERAGVNHPCCLTVRRVFGTWNNAIRAAGLRPRRRGVNKNWSRMRCPAKNRWCSCEVESCSAV